MIFLTVGTQLPFDRLVAAVDRWAARARADRVVAQIGPSDLRPAHIEATPFLAPARCRAAMAEADVIVAHAGMGTILGALELAKPLVVVPRRADLGEHRNDHQLATARRLREAGIVRVVLDADAVGAELDWLAGSPRAAREQRIAPYASGGLVAALRQFVETA